MDTPAQVETAPPPSSPTQTPLRELPKVKQDQAMARLWIRMAALFGEARWLAHAPRHVMPDWLDILGQRTPADIARGLSKLEATTPEYPPGAAAFRRLCHEFQPGTFSGGAKPLPRESVAQMLRGAHVESGKARAYLGWCQALAHGEKLTRAELEVLPALMLAGGDVVRPAEFCTASDDVEDAA